MSVKSQETETSRDKCVWWEEEDAESENRNHELKMSHFITSKPKVSSQETWQICLDYHPPKKPEKHVNAQ